MRKVMVGLIVLALAKTTAFAGGSTEEAAKHG